MDSSTAGLISRIAIILDFNVTLRWLVYILVCAHYEFYHMSVTSTFHALLWLPISLCLL